MKKMIAYMGCMLVCAMLTNSARSQTQPLQQVDQNTPRRLTDPTVRERLSNDWYKRNSTIKNQPVEWYDSRDGYYATYSKENKSYMTRYDREGNYVETLTKKDWNRDVPAELKSSFDRSEYKSYMINSYWEVSDPNQKAYYLELSDDQGKPVRLWADDYGNLSTNPRIAKP